MSLNRSLSLPLVAFYGLGTILGAGIYALIGEVAKEAEQYTPLSFLIASCLAFMTAASYAELCARFPQCAGSALYIQKAFHFKWLSGIVGWMVVATGVTSAAAISHGFAHYVALLFPVSPMLSITVLILLLGALAIWGIHQSATLIMMMTIIEVAGLVLIIFYGHQALNTVSMTSFTWPHSYKGIALGAFIAFYAYIGFEDMVNTAEETINPERVLPRAIFLAIIGATLLYLVVSWVLVTTLSAERLTETKLPLVDIITHQGQSPTLFVFIALVSVTNGILVQIIMASRMIYGMAKQNNAPTYLASINARTQTPVLATLWVILIILVMAYALPLVELAKLTSSLMLCIFMMIHTALIKIKLTEKIKPDSFSVPLWLPLMALCFTVLFLGIQFWG